MASISRPIQVGDTVSHRKLDTRGTVTEVDEEEAEIQIGVLRVRTKLSELQVIDDGESGETEISTGQAAGKITRSGGNDIRLESPGIEINLRGQRADEALESLERYLDSAYLAGLPFVRIIHGKGTGKLRQVIREALSHNPNVKSYEAGRGNEGGEGVTIAKLDM
jgi:DNA mismatch repair protein MutS2